MQVKPENIGLMACRCECVSRQQSHSKHAKPTQDHARPAGPRPSYPALDSLGPCRGEQASVDGLGSIHSPGVERGGSKRITAAVSRPVSIRSRKGTHLAKGDSERPS